MAAWRWLAGIDEVFVWELAYERDLWRELKGWLGRIWRWVREWVGDVFLASVCQLLAVLLGYLLSALNGIETGLMLADIGIDCHGEWMGISTR